MVFTIAIARYTRLVAFGDGSIVHHVPWWQADIRRSRQIRYGVRAIFSP